MASAFGKRIKLSDEKTAQINAKYCQLPEVNRMLLKLNAVRIPKIPEAAKSIIQIVLLVFSPQSFNNHEIVDEEL